MHTAQAGIFALGISSHIYLEFDVLDERQHRNIAIAFAAIREPRTTKGGVILTIGFRPELWRKMMPEDALADIEGFNRNVESVYLMPAT